MVRVWCDTIAITIAIASSPVTRWPPELTALTKRSVLPPAEWAHTGDMVSMASTSPHQCWQCTRTSSSFILMCDTGVDSVPRDATVLPMATGLPIKPRPYSHCHTCAHTYQKRKGLGKKRKKGKTRRRYEGFFFCAAATRPSAGLYEVLI